MKRTALHPAEARLYELWREYHDLHSAENLLEWDQETQLAAAGQAGRADVLATLAGLKHRRLTSSELGDVLASCQEIAEDGSLLAAQVRVARRVVERAVKVPERLARELAAAESKALAIWIEARRQADFSLFAAPLEHLVALKREQASALADGALECGGNDYDLLLDGWEPGASTAALVPLFRRLTDQLAPLVSAVAESGVTVDESPFRGDFPGPRQVKLGRRIVAAVGFDFNAGRLDPSTHPFCVGIHRGDVRMTYRLAEDDPRSFLFGVLHEAGHGLYEQGLPQEPPASPIADAESLGIHESQSLLWENHVGRSQAFWRWLAPIYGESFPGAAADPDVLWPALHGVRPSLIRVDADEVTYNLHIAVRFELELQLFGAGPGPELEVRDLPEAWNERIERYLGIRPRSDAEGVLQDIHWAHGSFGYFPTYTLGTMGAAQLFAAARRELGDLDGAFAAGEFGPLLGWLRERVHGHGRRYTAAELIERATGRPLAVEDLLDHLRRKVSAVYGPLD